MSYYEKAAEGKGYVVFNHRKIGYSEAHFHGAVEFIFIENGQLEAVVNGEKLTVNAGQCVFADSFSVHAYSEKYDNLGYVLLGDKDIFNRYFDILGGTPATVFNFSDFDVLEKLNRFWWEKKVTDDAKTAVFEGIVGIILGLIREKTNFSDRKEKGSSTVTDILSYAELNFDKDLSLTAIAKRFCYSKEHLSRLLHKYLSENWNVYVGRLRAKRADAMIKKNPERSVIDIAFDCGFESSNTFYRAYNKTFGKSPKNN